MEKIESFFARGRERHIVGFLLKPLLQSAGKLRFVFDYEDSHPLSHIPRFSASSN
jgi:hypothetical protein